MSITILDGGMGQELLARSKIEPTGLWSTQLLMDSPELIYGVHNDYFKSGAQIATTCTYPLHRDRLKPFEMEHLFETFHRQACEIAVKVRDAHGSGQVAGSLGPTTRSYRPDLALPVDQAEKVYAEIAEIQAPFVDFFICETMSSVEQARGALMGALTVNKPVWLAVTVDDNDGTKLRSGEPLEDILSLAQELKPMALLVNCSFPEAVDQAMPILSGCNLPFGGYANGFTTISTDFKYADANVNQLEKRTDLGPNTYAQFVDGWINQGATIVGGCCEVGPEHIQEITARRAN